MQNLDPKTQAGRFALLYIPFHTHSVRLQSPSLQDTVGLEKKSISIWQPRAAPQHTGLRANTSLWHEEETLGHMPEYSCQSCSGGMPDFFF